MGATVLSKELVEGPGRLSIFEKIGIVSSATDLAILLGGYTRSQLATTSGDSGNSFCIAKDGSVIVVEAVSSFRGASLDDAYENIFAAKPKNDLQKPAVEPKRSKGGFLGKLGLGKEKA